MQDRSLRLRTPHACPHLLPRLLHITAPVWSATMVPSAALMHGQLLERMAGDAVQSHAALDAPTIADAAIAGRWIDRKTRVVSVDFNMYNTNTRLLSVVRVTWIFHVSGLVDVGSDIFSMRMLMYSKNYPSDIYVRAPMEIVVIVYWLYVAQSPTVLTAVLLAWPSCQRFRDAPPRDWLRADYWRVWSLAQVPNTARHEKHGPLPQRPQIALYGFLGLPPVRTRFAWVGRPLVCDATQFHLRKVLPPPSSRPNRQLTRSAARAQAFLTKDFKNAIDFLFCALFAAAFVEYLVFLFDAERWSFDVNAEVSQGHARRPLLALAMRDAVLTRVARLPLLLHIFMTGATCFVCGASHSFWGRRSTTITLTQLRGSIIRAS